MAHKFILFFGLGVSSLIAPLAHAEQSKGVFECSMLMTTSGDVVGVQAFVPNPVPRVCSVRVSYRDNTGKLAGIAYQSCSIDVQTGSCQVELRWPAGADSTALSPAEVVGLEDPRLSLETEAGCELLGGKPVTQSQVDPSTKAWKVSYEAKLVCGVPQAPKQKQKKA